MTAARHQTKDQIDNAGHARPSHRSRDRRRKSRAPPEAESAPPAPPCAMVIFGAAGDLTKRLVVPALYNLAQAGQLSNHFQLVGVDHNTGSAEQWRKGLAAAMQDFVAQGGEFNVDAVDQSAWRWLSDRMSYLQGDLNDPGDLRSAARPSGRIGQDGGDGRELSLLSCGRRSFFRARGRSALAPPGLVTETDGQWRRVVIEKPFGHDLLSAKALNAEILKTLKEHQIYRIDHFLGKETVQNIMALRFANGLFEPLWNRAADRSCSDHRGRNPRRRAPRQVLREDRRPSRHGAEPRVPASRDDRDGAADFFRCRCGAQPKRPKSSRP